MNRLYTLAFALLPRRLQSRLFDWLADRYGFRGLFRFGNGSVACIGTQRGSDPFAKLAQPEKADNG